MKEEKGRGLGHKVVSGVAQLVERRTLDPKGPKLESRLEHKKIKINCPQSKML